MVRAQVVHEKVRLEARKIVLAEARVGGSEIVVLLLRRPTRLGHEDNVGSAGGARVVRLPRRRERGNEVTVLTGARGLDHKAPELDLAGSLVNDNEQGRARRALRPSLRLSLRPAVRFGTAPDGEEALLAVVVNAQERLVKVFELVVRAQAFKNLNEHLELALAAGSSSTLRIANDG